MRKYSQDCPIARTLDVIGDRWTLLILRDMFMGSARFSEFRERSSIPPKVLSARLKSLMENDLVEREVYSDHPLRAEYRLTDLGRSLLPIVLQLGMWGFDHTFPDEPEARTAVANAVYERIPESRKMLENAGYVVRRT
jgi:DNA-binding HxlR family transcriptional regulator